MPPLSKGERRRQELEKYEKKNLATYALRSAERRKKLGGKFREHPEASPLEYRTEYHRDRDRIVWSRAFKRLQHKTQVFPHYVTDHYRRRLTHSLEVAQIATTLARALKLNETAVEAMALGHDLGHTPFGHAGEQALNKILINMKKEKDFIKLKQPFAPIFGFDHCPHAIEVVSRIEREYSNGSGSYPGLNLSFDIRDGILKHMFDDKDKAPKYDDGTKRPFSRINLIVKYPHYKQYKNNKGSLEAQCVYFADKVAYLLSDIEDGLRSTIFSSKEMLDTYFVPEIWDMHDKRRPRHLQMELTGLDKDRFLLYRRRALAELRSRQRITFTLGGVSDTLCA